MPLRNRLLAACAAATGLFLSTASAETTPVVTEEPPPATSEASVPIPCVEVAPQPPACPPLCPPEGKEYFWVQAEYLLWWVRSGSLPFPLVITTSDRELVSGAPGTQVLVGQEHVNTDPYSGFRLRAGTYLDQAGIGFDLGGFLLETRTATSEFHSGANGLPPLGRPFRNAETGAESVNLLSTPNGFTGGVGVSARTRLWGAEANVTNRVGIAPIEVVYGGFRYLGLREQVAISDGVNLQPGGLGFFAGQPVDPGDLRYKRDLFRTSNNFYGAQIGLGTGFRQGALDVGLRSSVGLGVTAQDLTVEGRTTLVPVSGQTASVPGGLLAVGSNLRRESRCNFAVVPEVDLSVGYQVMPWARVSLGYNFLYCSSVIRPGDQMDRTINLTHVPISPTYQTGTPTARPAPLFETSDFWAQGLNFGLTVSF